MTDTWISESFVTSTRVGTITFVPGNPKKGWTSAIRVEMLSPHESMLLRGPALKALLDFIEKHPQCVQDTLSGQT